MNKANKQGNLAQGDVYSKLFFIVLIISSCYLFALVLFMDIKKILPMMPDDAAYFFKIAANFVMGKGLTFDGINKTNGFQPLWLIVLVNIYYFFQSTPEVMFRVFLIVEVIFLIISSLLLYSVYRDFFSRQVSLIGGIIFLLLLFFRTMNGMESSLLLFTIIALFYFGHKKQVFTQHKLSSDFLFGAILGLVMLARLDMVFLAILIYMFCFIKLLVEKKGRRDNLIRFLVILISSIIIVAPYLLYNYIVFAQIVPISGLLKSNFPYVVDLKEGFSLVGTLYTGLVLCSVYYLFYFIFIVRLRRSNLNYFRISLLILAMANLLHYLNTVLFMRWALFNWHFITYWLFLSVVIIEPLAYCFSSHLFCRYKKLYWVLVLLLIFAGIGKQTIKTMNSLSPLASDFTVVSYEAAIWSLNNTQETDVFAMKDAGNFSYFSQREVVNLDGLVNNMEYQEALKNQKINEYLNSKKVKYLAQHAFYNEKINSGNYKCFIMEYKSYKYKNTVPNKILLKREDEIYRSPLYFDGQNKTVFIIWKLRHDNNLPVPSDCVTANKY